REERRDRGRVDRRQGDAGQADASDGRAVSALRLLFACGLHHPGPFGDRTRARPVAAAPPLVPGAVLPERGGSGRSPRRATRRSLGAGLTQVGRYGRAVARPRNAAERRAAWWYRVRGYRILGTNVWMGGYELDVIARRGRSLVFCEVKSKSGTRFGD